MSFLHSSIQKKLKVIILFLFVNVYDPYKFPADLTEAKKHG